MNSFRRAARIRLLSASGPGPPTIPWARELPGRAATSLPERQGNAKREQRWRMCPQPRLKPLKQPRPHVPRMTGSPSSWGEPAGGIIPFAHAHQGRTGSSKAALKIGRCVVECRVLHPPRSTWCRPGKGGCPGESLRRDVMGGGGTAPAALAGGVSLPRARRRPMVS